MVLLWLTSNILSSHNSVRFGFCLSFRGAWSTGLGLQKYKDNHLGRVCPLGKIYIYIKLFAKLLSPWYIYIYQYIHISSALWEWFHYKKLLPARVIWINMQCLQYIEQEYLPVATCWLVFCAQECFLNQKPSHDALHICIYWYTSRTQNLCKQLYMAVENANWTLLVFARTLRAVLLLNSTLAISCSTHSGTSGMAYATAILRPRTRC